jgi:hypothetical protein
VAQAHSATSLVVADGGAALVTAVQDLTLVPAPLVPAWLAMGMSRRKRQALPGPDVPGCRTSYGWPAPPSPGWSSVPAPAPSSGLTLCLPSLAQSAPLRPAVAGFVTRLEMSEYWAGCWFPAPSFLGKQWSYRVA